METGVASRDSSVAWLNHYVSIGLTFGLVAAPVFALVMTLLARWLYHENEDAFRFKLAMGVVTLIGVGVSAPYLAVVIALRELFSGGITLFSSAILLMWGFGVYLSQIIARQYIAEFSPRKRKGKPA
ncbi:MAG: hypothetical protein OXG78_10285 [Chloroflexi bacterium]|nr:hypothetical protein [Chloroflexota bacterium]